MTHFSTITTKTFLGDRLDGCSHIVDVTSSRAGIGIVGLLSPNVLSKLADIDLDPSVFTNNQCCQCRAAGVHVMILRADLERIPAYQIYLTRDFGQYMWDAILNAGRSENVAPIGTQTLEKLLSGA